MLESNEESPMAPTERIESTTTTTTPAGRTIIKRSIFELPLGLGSDDPEQWTLIQRIITTQKNGVTLKTLACQRDEDTQSLHYTFTYYESPLPTGGSFEHTLESDIEFELAEDGEFLVPQNIEQATLTTYLTFPSGTRLLRSVRQGSLSNLFLQGFGVWKQNFYSSDAEDALFLSTKEQIGFFDNTEECFEGRLEVYETNGVKTQLIGHLIADNDVQGLDGPDCRKEVTYADGQVLKKVGQFEKGRLLVGAEFKHKANQEYYVTRDCNDRSQDGQCAINRLNNAVSLKYKTENGEKISSFAMIREEDDQLTSVTVNIENVAYSIFRDLQTGLLSFETGATSGSRRNLSAKDGKLEAIFLQTESRLLELQFIQPSRFTRKSFFASNTSSAVLQRPVPPRQREMAQVAITLPTGQKISKTGVFEAPPGKIPVDLRAWALIDGMSIYQQNNITVATLGLYDHYQGTFKGVYKTISSGLGGVVVEEKLTSKTDFVLDADGKVTTPLQMQDVKIEIAHVLPDRRAFPIMRRKGELLHQGTLEGVGETVTYRYNSKWEKTGEEHVCGTFLNDSLIEGSVTEHSSDGVLKKKGSFKKVLAASAMTATLELHGPNCTFTDTNPTRIICTKGYFEQGRLIRGTIVEEQQSSSVRKDYIDMEPKESHPYTLSEYYKGHRFILEFYQGLHPLVLKIGLDAQKRLISIEAYHVQDDLRARKNQLWVVKWSEKEGYSFQKKIGQITQEKAIDYFQKAGAILLQYKLIKSIPPVLNAAAIALLAKEDAQKKQKAKQDADKKAEKKALNLERERLAREQSERAVAIDMEKQQQIQAKRDAENLAKRAHKEMIKDLVAQTQQMKAETIEIKRSMPEELSRTNKKSKSKVSEYPGSMFGSHASPTLIPEAVNRRAGSPSVSNESVERIDSSASSPASSNNLTETEGSSSPERVRCDSTDELFKLPLSSGDLAFLQRLQKELVEPLLRDYNAGMSPFHS